MSDPSPSNALDPAMIIIPSGRERYARSTYVRTHTRCKTTFDTRYTASLSRDRCAPKGLGIKVVRLESRLMERRLTQPRRLQSSDSEFKHFRLIRHRH